MGIFFPHFVNGDGSSSSITIINTSGSSGILGGSLAVLFSDSQGEPIHPESIFDLHEHAVIEDEGDEIALVITQYIRPLSQLSLKTNGKGELQVGHVSVVNWDSEDKPILEDQLNGVLKFSVPGFGAASILANKVDLEREEHPGLIFPVRYQYGRVDTGIAISNLSESNEQMTCSAHIESGSGFRSVWSLQGFYGNGHKSLFISELFSFSGDDVLVSREYFGTVRCKMNGNGPFVAIGLEFDFQNSVFTTIPAVPVTE